MIGAGDGIKQIDRRVPCALPDLVRSSQAVLDLCYPASDLRVLQQNELPITLC
jgi:hypothetical protein